MMKMISVHISEPYLDKLKDLVDMCLYPTRAKAIRIAIRDLIVSEHPKYRGKQIVKNR